jgi:hypothetical protein
MQNYIENILNNKPDKTELISNFDFYEYFGKDINIVKNKDIQNYDIENLVNNKYRSSIIYIENDTIAHWVLLSLNFQDEIEYFDSYGFSYKKDPFLKDYFKQINVKFNRIRYQKLAPNVATCGKHVSMRLLCFLEFKMNLDIYYKFMKYLKKSEKETYDNLVLIFVKLTN